MGGNVVTTGIVEGITGFGAFIALEDGRKGLVHISEIAHTFVKDINDFLSVDDEVNIKIIGEDDNGRLKLSIKQTQTDPQEEARQQQDFDDMLSKFIKQSDERQLDLKRNIRKKSGTGGRRY